MTGDGQDAQPASEPALKVVAGRPSAEELAALAVALSAVLAARGGPAQAGLPGRASPGWADRSRMMSAPPRPGRDAWRRSARPG
jgi:Acyl-CoA carboxylase epsilon subunit